MTLRKYPPPAVIPSHAMPFQQIVVLRKSHLSLEDVQDAAEEGESKLMPQPVPAGSGSRHGFHLLAFKLDIPPFAAPPRPFVAAGLEGVLGPALKKAKTETEEDGAVGDAGDAVGDAVSKEGESAAGRPAETKKKEEETKKKKKKKKKAVVNGALSKKLNKRNTSMLSFDDDNW